MARPPRVPQVGASIPSDGFDSPASSAQRPAEAADGGSRGNPGAAARGALASDLDPAADDVRTASNPRTGR